MADPLGTGLVAHPYSSHGPTPGSWEGGTLVLQVRSFYINRSIEDENFVYIREYLPLSFWDYSRGYESLVVGRVAVGGSFRFPDKRSKDGICVIGEEPDNARIYVSYHASMVDGHVCTPHKQAPENVVKALPPTGLVSVGDATISTENTLSVKVLGVNKGDMVRIFEDDACRNAVGFGIAVGEASPSALHHCPPDTIRFLPVPVPPWRSCPDCSSASVDYGVSELEAPAGVILLEPVTASHADDTPKVKIEGVRGGDMVRLYKDDLCEESISYPVRANGSSVDIETWPLPEGDNYQFYVQYTRANANRSDCWDTGLNYNVLVDSKRKFVRIPTLEMPEDIDILDGEHAWSDGVVSDNPTPMIRLNPTIYNRGKWAFIRIQRAKTKLDTSKQRPEEFTIRLWAREWFLIMGTFPFI